MTIQNSYCINNTSYAYWYYNGSLATTTAGRVTKETLQKYDVKLGQAFAYDVYNINEGYPVLEWENQRPEMALNINQTYIKVGENISLNIKENQEISELIGNNYNNTNFTWKSTNEDIASVDQNGIATGLKDGYTTIYAKHEETGMYAMCVINVSQNIATPMAETGNRFVSILKSNGTVWGIRKQCIWKLRKWQNRKLIKSSAS